MFRSPHTLLVLSGFLLVTGLGLLPPRQANGQELATDFRVEEPGVGEPSSERDGSIHFSFDRTPWREVIQWIAEECDLALHYEDLPTGSFSYSDPAAFSDQAAIDRLNLFLLPQGYTLVQSGKLMSVINLSDPRSMQTLDVLARFVKVDDLGDLPKHDVVKCIFPLGELDVDDALDELSVLNLMTTPAPLNKTNQLMLTDTVANLSNVKAIIDSFQPTTLDNGTVMKTFTLQHVEAEDILSVARPHLGLATGETIGIDVSISSDLVGKNIFVTGSEDRVKLIEGLVTSLDVPQNVLSTKDGDAVLQSHLVEGGNVEVVYNVLQTLLAGKPARISIDRSSSSIVALASPDTQEEIRQTVSQIQAQDADFEIIPLKHTDPYFIISLLDEMLDLPSALDDPDDVDPDAPKIDADPGNRRLFVRAKRHRIEQIKKIVAGLDVSTTENEKRIRILPIRGEAAERTLEAAARFWDRENPILYFPNDQDDRSTERVINEPPVTKPAVRRAKLTSLAAMKRGADENSPRILTNKGIGEGDPVRAQLTPRGLLIQSDDTEALNALEESMLLFGNGDSVPSKPIVFYLRYVKPDVALRMLAELLDGGETAREGEAGTLINGYVSGGSYVSTLLTSRDGLITLMAGSLTVVADSRLNRLIAQGTTEDLEIVEQYLSIIDKDKGLADVATYGESHIVELQYTNAADVAETLREAFAGRVAASTKGGQPGAPGQAGRPEGQEQKPKDSDNKKKAAANPRSSQPAIDLEPVMTVAVHEASNSIVITAPEQLAQQALNLVERIDTMSQETVEIVAPENTALLEALFGEQTESRSNSSRRTPSGSSGRSMSRSSFEAAIRERFGK